VFEGAERGAGGFDVVLLGNGEHEVGGPVGVEGVADVELGDEFVFDGDPHGLVGRAVGGLEIGGGDAHGPRAGGLHRGERGKTGDGEKSQD